MRAVGAVCVFVVFYWAFHFLAESFAENVAKTETKGLKI